MCWPTVSSEHVYNSKPELEVFVSLSTSVGIHQDLNDFLILEIEQPKLCTEMPWMSLRVDVIVQVRRDCQLAENFLVCFDGRCFTVLHHRTGF